MGVVDGIAKRIPARSPSPSKPQPNNFASNDIGGAKPRLGSIPEPKKAPLRKPYLAQPAYKKVWLDTRNGATDSLMALALVGAGILVGVNYMGGYSRSQVVPIVIPNTNTSAVKSGALPVVAHQPKFYGLQYPRLQIPKINVDAAVEPEGKTKDGNMDMPQGAWVVGWYKFGPEIGAAGNAVLGGHLGAPNQDAVFKHLDKLGPGDIITVEVDPQKKVKFRVVKTQLVTTANAPLATIFGPSPSAHLNLISCNGAWSNNDYSNRLIVFTDLMN